MSAITLSSDKRLPILYDRSRVVTDWQCQRRRFWNYEYGGKGVVPDTENQALFLGTTLHDGLSGIARGVDIDLIGTTAFRGVYEALTNDPIDAQTNQAASFEDINYAKEQATLIEGLLRGFHKHVWPQLTLQYPKIIAIEQEMTYEHDNLIFMAKPDLIVGNDQGEVVYVEYKSTSSKKDGWINSWNTAVQLHSTVRAVKATLGVDVTSVVVQGLYKGYENYGKQNSPFCYSYTRGGQPPFSQTQLSYDYKAGFKRTPVWEMEGGVKQWVKDMPEEILANQFPRTPPIYLKDALIDSFFKQRHMRENEIRLAMDIMAGDPASKEEIMATSFQQRFDQCVPGWGTPCPYRNLCFRDIEDPLTTGFQLREPHHLPEMERWTQDQEEVGYGFAI